MTTGPSRKRRLRSNRRIATALALLLAGCGVITAVSHPEPPSHVRPIDPDSEWTDIKASRAASSKGSLVLTVHPTPSGNTSMIPSVRMRLMPYAEGIREELEAVLRWRYGGALYSPSKVHDAPARIDDALGRYRQALAQARLEDLFQELDVPLDHPVRLSLAAGDYLLLGEYRTLGRGPTYKVWVWLHRILIRPSAAVDVVLGDDDRLCSESWAPSGTSCR